MLDPRGRREVLDTVRELHGNGVTVLTITHFMSEAVEGNRVIVMDQGRTAMDGPPRDIFSQTEKLRDLGLDLPPVTQLAQRLHQRHPAFSGSLLTVDEIVKELCRFPQPVEVLA